MTADCSFVTGLAVSRFCLQQQGWGMGSLQTLSTLVSYFKINTHGGRTEHSPSSEKLRPRVQAGMHRGPLHEWRASLTTGQDHLPLD